MRRFRRSERGLSEIVGTLMLVVIVVAAATLLAAFVASYQKQLQTEETFSHDQSLESIVVLGLTTTVGGGVFASFDFTIASEYVNPSGIVDVYINGNPLLDFAWYNVSTATYGTYNAVTSGNALVVLPFQQVQITTCLVASCSPPGFPPGTTISDSFLPGDAPVPNSYIKFDIFTHLHNDFSRVYLPPTSLAVVSQESPSVNNPFTLLDGSSSFQTGGNASIVIWDWSVAGGGPVSSSTTIGTPSGGDTAGAIAGSGNATFTVPSGFTFGGTDTVSFAFGQPTTTAGGGPGGCVLSDATLTPTGETYTPPSMTVTFNYGATAVGTGCGMTVSTVLSQDGVALTPTSQLSPALNVSAEEYEISPALPAPISSSTPYLVTLLVTNSDGLEGTITVSYAPPA